MALILPDKSGRTFNFSPGALEIKEKKVVMNILKQLLFTMTIIVGISITASAQKDGDKKPPPKPSPPVIVVPPTKNPPKEDKPKSDDKRKRPEIFRFSFVEE